VQDPPPLGRQEQPRGHNDGDKQRLRGAAILRAPADEGAGEDSGGGNHQRPEDKSGGGSGSAPCGRPLAGGDGSRLGTGPAAYTTAAGRG
jgi:hypothetical protein